MKRANPCHSRILHCSSVKPLLPVLMRCRLLYLKCVRSSLYPVAGALEGESTCNLLSLVRSHYTES
ncbi:hypothetical protein BCR37DRAFT_384798 [Protomyces lactucae-debilis]|uniref:Uncharacterized protein n=1 Tax=Protomyces lactucae-debilis TaxID=2754530 RepID=A0A1Y2EQA7_PROLT|nr:uncharacterized protein BCR37DRAFT_384798 [Protomyces lactucae-debilis]ORY73474.1 hypothetical protein BCR37DRAFT_384798 [Protomyces lactucae-debilis]